MGTFSSTAAAAAMLLGLVAAQPAAALDYPTRPVRLVVPYPPGSGTDIVARMLGQKLGASLGQPFVIENRPGAGATLGTDAVAKAEPDGYTLLMADVGPLAISPTFQPKLPYDVGRDFAPVSQVAVLPFMLAVNPSLPVRTVSELVALAKTKPGDLNYASVGNGTIVHLVTELFKRSTGTDMVHIPYRGSAPAVTDLVAGRVSVMFVNLLSAVSFVNSGQLRALAIGSPQRSQVLPDLPTFREAGLRDFEASAWFGLLLPAATPQEIVRRLNAEAVRALTSADLKAKLAEQGAEVVVGTPEQFGTLIRDERAKWADVIRTSGIRPD